MASQTTHHLTTAGSTRPQLPALRSSARDGAHTLSAWCPWCETVHTHGTGYGNRAPHCYSGRGSPFATSGYDLVPGGAGEAEDAVPDAPNAGGCSLRASVDVARFDLQSALLKAVLRRRRAGSVISSKVGDVRVAVLAPSWNMRRDGELEFTAGSDLLGMITALFGTPEGVAAVRILEGVTGAELDAQAVREISAAVDGWVARGAPRGEGRS